MTSENVTEADLQAVKAVDDRLIDELVSRAQAEGLQLTGEGGLLQQLTKRLLESALEGEITEGPPGAFAVTGRSTAAAISHRPPPHGRGGRTSEAPQASWGPRR